MSYNVHPGTTIGDFTFEFRSKGPGRVRQVGVKLPTQSATNLLPNPAYVTRSNDLCLLDGEFVGLAGVTGLGGSQRVKILTATDVHNYNAGTDLVTPGTLNASQLFPVHSRPGRSDVAFGVVPVVMDYDYEFITQICDTRMAAFYVPGAKLIVQPIAAADLPDSVGSGRSRAFYGLVPILGYLDEVADDLADDSITEVDYTAVVTKGLDANNRFQAIMRGGTTTLRGPLS